MASALATGSTVPQLTSSQEQLESTRVQFPAIQEHQQRLELQRKLNSFLKLAIEACALLFGFALIGFSGLELGATISGVLGYSKIVLFSLPFIAVCEIIFVLAILREYGSIRFW